MLKVRSSHTRTFMFGQECIAGMLFLGALFVAISLVSYHPHDASWFYFSTAPHALHNKGGMVGAHLAALLFYLFGSASVLFVGLLFFVSYLTFFAIPAREEWHRLSASVFAIGAAAGLLHAYNIDFMRSACPGGLVGMLLYTRMVHLFGLFGSFVFLNLVLLASLIIITRFSFIIWIQYACRMLSLGGKQLAVPLYIFARACVRYSMIPVRAMGDTLKNIYTGTLVPNDEYSVKDFEQSLLMAGAELDMLNTPEKKDELIDALTHEKMQIHVVPRVLHAASVPVERKQQQTINKPYALPKVTIFALPAADKQDVRLTKELEERAKILEEKLQRFGVSGTVTSIKRGPVVTLFEYQPDIDTKVSKIIALEDDLALALQALSIRIIAPIPGRSVVGFEVANSMRKDVLFSRVVRSVVYEQFKGVLPLVLGQDTSGADVVVDLARMPHLLVAGSTGSGKSVALNAMLISLLCKCTPEQLKLILIDPKRLEFASYADLPHLLFPIITESKRATMALRWVVKQMEDRYATMALCGARNFADYNALVGVHEQVTAPLPYIVVVIDELADLMMTSGRDIEDLIARIAQMARAAGIHMLVATQRPSVDVITGLIKVNFPSRISFRVTSKIDSRTILVCGGAD